MFDNTSQPGHTLTFTEQELNVVMTALYEAALPAKLTIPVINKVQQARDKAREGVAC